MTSEQRRYERLLERHLRGLPLKPHEALELAQHQSTLPLARREQAVFAEFKRWFAQAPSEAEKQVLARLERAALVRARHNSRASLRLLTSEHVAANLGVQPRASTVATWRETLCGKHWRRLVVGLMFGSAGALAFGGGAWRRSLNGQWQEPQNAPAPLESASVNQAPVAAPLPTEPEMPDSAASGVPNVYSPAAESTSESQHAVGGAPHNTQPSAHHTRSNPSDLLAEAREALRQNDAKRALARYRELVRRYPKSSEAASVRITVAQLELQTGSAQRALAGFEGYLAQGGSLGPEALAGKVQALNALGQPSQAQRAMREYLARFPNEVHSKGYRRALSQ